MPLPAASVRSLRGQGDDLWACCAFLSVAKAALAEEHRARVPSQLGTGPTARLRLSHTPSHRLLLLILASGRPLLRFIGALLR